MYKSFFSLLPNYTDCLLMLKEMLKEYVKKKF